MLTTPPLAFCGVRVHGNDFFAVATSEKQQVRALLLAEILLI